MTFIRSLRGIKFTITSIFVYCDKKIGEELKRLLPFSFQNISFMLYRLNQTNLTGLFLICCFVVKQLVCV